MCSHLAVVSPALFLALNSHHHHCLWSPSIGTQHFPLYPLAWVSDSPSVGCLLRCIVSLPIRQCRRVMGTRWTDGVRWQDTCKQTPRDHGACSFILSWTLSLAHCCYADIWLHSWPHLPSPYHLWSPSIGKHHCPLLSLAWVSGWVSGGLSIEWQGQSGNGTLVNKPWETVGCILSFYHRPFHWLTADTLTFSLIPGPIFHLSHHLWSPSIGRHRCPLSIHQHRQATGTGWQCQAVGCLRARPWNL